MKKTGNRGVSGNGQESHKHLKIHQKPGRQGGGKPKNASGQNTQTVKRTIIFIWEKGQLRVAARINQDGIGVIPLEDQLRAIQQQGGQDIKYVPFNFVASPQVIAEGTGLQLFGQDLKGDTQHLKVKLKEGDFLIESFLGKNSQFWLPIQQVSKR